MQLMKDDPLIVTEQLLSLKEIAPPAQAERSMKMQSTTSKLCEVSMIRPVHVDLVMPQIAEVRVGRMQKRMRNEIIVLNG
jgi:hypothetical protein